MAKQYDPRMHTAEHILNQTVDSMFGCGRCFSAHIEKKKSKCDYHFNRGLTEAEVSEIVKRVNEVIDQDLNVTEEFIPVSQAQAHFNIERLPDDAGDDIRIVRVGDYDACPCIGPHVESTGQIGVFRTISSSFNDGVLRIRFKLAAPEKMD